MKREEEKEIKEKAAWDPLVFFGTAGLSRGWHPSASPKEPSGRTRFLGGGMRGRQPREPCPHLPPQVSSLNPSKDSKTSLQVNKFSACIRSRVSQLSPGSSRVCVKLLKAPKDVAGLGSSLGKWDRAQATSPGPTASTAFFGSTRERADSCPNRRQAAWRVTPELIHTVRVCELPVPVF